MISTLVYAYVYDEIHLEHIVVYEKSYVMMTSWYNSINLYKNIIIIVCFQ